MNGETIGAATLYRDDCLKVLASMPDDSVDGVFTDPPYSSGGMFRGDRAAKPSQKYQSSEYRDRYQDFHGDNRDQRSFGYWSALWLSECLRVTKPGGVIVAFTDWRQLPTMTDAIQAGGWIWRGILSWDKTEAARPQKGRYRQQCEFMVWGTKGGREQVGPTLPGAFRHSVHGQDKIHMTEKPFGLMCDVLRIVQPGGVVLDPFMGSGATGIAAKRVGLGFVGIELSEHWYGVARERIAEAAKCDGIFTAAPSAAVPLFGDAAG